MVGRNFGDDWYSASDRASVLLVDDDTAILEGVADLLALHGYEVITATDGRSALAAMRQSVPDLVVSDIMMPVMDGYEFYETVRDNPEWTSIPFIFLTARGQRVDVRRGQRLGADAYVTKPFEPEDLLIAVRARLKRVRDIQSAATADVERMKEQLITIFSHELRTPLAYIYGYVNLLREQRDDLDPAAAQEMIEGAHRGTKRLVALVEDLMMLVQIESGVVETEIGLERGQMPVRAIVETVLERHQRPAEERGVALQADVAPDAAECRYSLYIESALSRLVDNAIKFCRKGAGHVTIRARRSADAVELAVVDDGIGIEPAKQQVIFERFYQLNRDVMEQQGIGLGLTLARMLARLHGGDVHVQSAPGAGSTFTISLPAGDGPCPPGAAGGA